MIVAPRLPDGNARAIHTSAITGPRQLVNPSAQINVIHGRQAATSRYPEKNYGARRKAFFLCEERLGSRRRFPFLGLSFKAIGAVEADSDHMLCSSLISGPRKRTRNRNLRTEQLALPLPAVCLFAGGGLSRNLRTKMSCAEWATPRRQGECLVEPEIVARNGTLRGGRSSSNEQR